MNKATKVFYIAFALVILTVSFGVIAPEAFEQATGTIRTYINAAFGWYYLMIMALLLIFVIVIVVSPYGKIRLGRDSDRPEFSTFTWLAMLFSAGMGIGLVFYGASEPLSHFAIQPATAEPGTDEAFKESLQRTYYHWGIHVWAMYGMVALSLAFFQFRKGQPALISTTLRPLFGDRMNGPLGTLVDVLAVFATVFGVATSLGFGAAQINGGLAYLFGAPQEYWVQMVIIGVVTLLFMKAVWGMMPARLKSTPLGTKMTISGGGGGSRLASSISRRATPGNWSIMCIFTLFHETTETASLTAGPPKPIPMVGLTNWPMQSDMNWIRIRRISGIYPELRASYRLFPSESEL